MKEILCTSFAAEPQLQLGETTAPTPGRHDVEVAVHAAAVSFMDLLMAQGRYQMRPELPYVPGTDAAGTSLRARHRCGRRGRVGRCRGHTLPRRRSRRLRQLARRMGREDGGPGKQHGAAAGGRRLPNGRCRAIRLRDGTLCARHAGPPAGRRNAVRDRRGRRRWAGCCRPGSPSRRTGDCWRGFERQGCCRARPRRRARESIPRKTCASASGR